MMNILVTGCNGALGQPLVKELRSRGYIVFGVDSMHLGDPLTMRADVGNYRQLMEAFEAFKPDMVYHLAAEFGRHNGEQFFEQVWDGNLTGTRNVLELCNLYGAELIFASSSEVYGELVPTDDNGEVLPLHEDMTKVTPHLTNEYAISKFTNELQIRSFKERHDLPVTVLRFFNTYGPGERYHRFRSVVALFCHCAMNGIPFDVFQGYSRTFMFIDDFIPTLANVCEAEKKHDVYNIGGFDHRSIEEMAEIVLDATGADKSLARLKGVDQWNVLDKIPDITRAREDLGHDPVFDLERGVPLTIEWMRAQNSQWMLA